jgi:hypothetical protein
VEKKREKRATFLLVYATTCGTLNKTEREERFWYTFDTFIPLGFVKVARFS